MAAMAPDVYRDGLPRGGRLPRRRDIGRWDEIIGQCRALRQDLDPSVPTEGRLRDVLERWLALLGERRAIEAAAPRGLIHGTARWALLGERMRWDLRATAILIEDSQRLTVTPAGLSEDAPTADSTPGQGGQT